MSSSSSKTSLSTSGSFWMRHFPALLFGWFFFGMFLCGLLAPEDRVRELESSIITEGWHLSLMSLVFGGLVIAAYILRARKTESTPPPQ